MQTPPLSQTDRSVSKFQGQSDIDPSFGNETTHVPGPKPSLVVFRPKSPHVEASNKQLPCESFSLGIVSPVVNKKLYSMSLKLLGNPLLLVVLPWESLHRNKEPWSSTLPPAPPSPAPSDGRMRMRRVRSCVSKVCSSSARPLTVGGSQGSRGRVSPGRRRRPAKEDGKKR